MGVSLLVFWSQKKAQKFTAKSHTVLAVGAREERKVFYISWFFLCVLRGFAVKF